MFLQEKDSEFLTFVSMSILLSLSILEMRLKVATNDRFFFFNKVTDLNIDTKVKKYPQFFLSLHKKWEEKD